MTKIIHVLLLSICLTAAATPTFTNQGFSFREWVEEIITHPTGKHLSAEEAIASWYAFPFRDSYTNSARPGSVFERLGDPATCNEQGKLSAPIPDAVTCIMQLAAKGTEFCPTNGNATYCQFGAAVIEGTSKDGQQLNSYCNDLARGAGYVMDSCSRADNTVEGAGYVEGNGDILLRIHSPDGVGRMK
ncbi:hypothetical protein QBC37DRAFT_448828 [Rhypophila decipiens]|uniref:Uncharacterized protein n=1 Tax=Rhypophila decipiens TaxID=261697 RepID=A0AAN7BE17_9PEZI|nr:hypothetical protein QBC37DRAFT_448828 [Rhypophila decipiens]